MRLTTDSSYRMVPRLSYLIHRKRMLRRIGTTLLIMMAATATAGARGARSITGTCAPRDATSDRLVSTFKSIVTRTTMGGTVIRTQLGIATVSYTHLTLP